MLSQMKYIELEFISFVHHFIPCSSSSIDALFYACTDRPARVTQVRPVLGGRVLLVPKGLLGECLSAFSNEVHRIRIYSFVHHFIPCSSSSIDA